MRKLIEINQDHLVICDNKDCDFKVPNETGAPSVSIMKQFLNVACPKCGSNLLTEEDYTNSLKILNAMNWINRWFSWVTLFMPKAKKKTKGIIHIHKGVTIHEKSEQHDLD